jgi:hypothetical protein
MIKITTTFLLCALATACTTTSVKTDSRLIDLEVAASEDGRSLSVGMSGFWLDTPNRRTLEVISKGADGSIVYDERVVAMLSYDASPKGGFDKARATIELPAGVDARTVEVRPIDTRPGAQ